MEAVMLAVLILFAVFSGNTARQIHMAAYAVNLFAVVLIGDCVRRFLRRRRYPAETNRIYTSAVVFGFSLLVMGLVNAGILYGSHNGFRQTEPEKPPITVGDLTGMNDSGYLKSYDSDDSVFLGQFRSSEHPMDGGGGRKLGYTVTEVKMPVLYEFCFENLFEQRIMRHDYTFGERYEETDPEPWQSDRAYRLRGNMGTSGTWLVCYDRYILQITADWELTEEQMHRIGEKLTESAD